MARPLRIQFEGAVYYLVVRANNRQPLFRDERDRRRYLELLGRYQSQLGFKIYCYLLISRQLHLLIQTPKGNVSKIMQCLGTSYTSYFNRRHKRHGTLFEGRYKSYLIENEEYLREVTRYIHRNHFQSGSKTNKWTDAPWSSYRVYLGLRRSELLDTGPVLSHFGRNLREQRRGYRRFVEHGKLRGGAYLSAQNTKPGINILSPLEKTLSVHQGLTDEKEKNGLRVAEKILHEVSLSLDPSDRIEDLRESRRGGLVRHLAMYLIRRQTSLPLRAIGKLLGVKAPAVALGIGKVERLLKQGDFSKKYKSLLASDAFLLSLPELDGGLSSLERELLNETATT